MIGKNVIVRTKGQGIHVGTIELISDSKVKLTNTRRIWKCFAHEDSGSISDIAFQPLRADKKHFLGPVTDFVELESPDGIEAIETTQSAYESLMSYAC